MEKKMNKNKIIIYGTILFILLVIAIPSTYKVIKKHQDRLLRNTVQKIVETAKDCYYNASCVDDKITLEELYEKTDLERMSNPITKEVFHESSYVLVSENFKFYDKKE